MKPSLPFFQVVLSIVVSIPAQASTYRVRPDGTGDYPTIQAAIEYAADGDTVALSDGVFTGIGNRDIDFYGRAVTVRSESGDSSMCILNCQAGHYEWHRGFVFHRGEGSASILSHLTIQNAYVDNVLLGGAVLCANSSSPTILNCVFSSNKADGGGGLACTEASHPYVANCVFDHNRGSGLNGGAIHCRNSSNPQFIKCSVDNNHSYVHGGGAFCDEQSSPTFSDCTFTNNSSVYSGGGMRIDHQSSPILSNCLFRSNTAPEWHGGGVYCADSASPQFIGCSFIENWAGGVGGGMLTYNESRPIFNGCLFAYNTAEMGGGLCSIDDSVTCITCTFSGNTAEIEGGAIVLSRSRSAVTDCSLILNSAASGSGFSLESSSPVLRNTIVAFGSDGEAVNCMDAYCAPVILCCDLFGNEGGDWVGCIQDQYGINDNISEDPLFCDAENGDLTLHNDSPCADENNLECGQIGAFGIGCSPSTDVAVGLVGTREVCLFPSWPNPFSGVTLVRYTIAERAGGSRAVLSVHDPTGRLIRTLVDANQPAGSYGASWDGKNESGELVAAGVYFYQLRVRGEKHTLRANLVR